jgi:hypothetical protein
VDLTIPLHCHFGLCQERFLCLQNIYCIKNIYIYVYIYIKNVDYVKVEPFLIYAHLCHIIPFQTIDNKRD